MSLILLLYYFLSYKVVTIMRRHMIDLSMAVPGCTLSIPLSAGLCVTCELITFDFFFFQREGYSFSLLLLTITIQQQKPC